MLPLEYHYLLHYPFGYTLAYGLYHSLVGYLEL